LQGSGDVARGRRETYARLVSVVNDDGIGPVIDVFARLR
jgi:hypothetical protein